MAQRLVLLVHAPHHVRQPGHAAFHQDYAQAGEAFEYPLQHQAHQVGHVELRQAGVRLQVVGGHAGGQRGGVGDHRGGGRVDVQRQPGALGGGEQRPIKALAERDAVCGGEDARRHHARMAAEPFHLRGRLLRVLQRHAGGHQVAVVRRQPVGERGVVGGAAHGGGVVGVRDAGHGTRVVRQHRARDAAPVQVVLRGPGRIGAAAAAVRCGRVGARASVLPADAGETACDTRSAPPRCGTARPGSRAPLPWGWSCVRHSRISSVPSLPRRRAATGLRGRRPAVRPAAPGARSAHGAQRAAPRTERRAVTHPAPRYPPPCGRSGASYRPADRTVSCRICR